MSRRRARARPAAGWRTGGAVALVLAAAGTLATPLPHFIDATVEGWLAGIVTFTREWRILVFGHGITVLMLLLTAGLSAWSRRTGVAGTARSLGLGAPGASQIRAGAVAAFPVLAAMAVVTLSPVAFVRPADDVWYLLPQILLDTAFREEFVFRGFLHPLIRRRLGRWTGAALSAAVFALMHLPAIWRQTGGWSEGVPWPLLARTLAFAFLWGVGVARLAERGGGSIWVPVAVHFGVDAHQLFSGVYPAAAPWLGWIVPSGQWACAAALLLLGMDRRRSRPGRRRP